MSLLSVLFHLQKFVSVFWNFNFWPRYFRKRSLCLWKQPHFLKNSDKSLLSPEQKKRNLRHGFVDKRQLKAIMPKSTFSRINLEPFCSSKHVHFFKFSFREICFSDKFWERQFFSIANVWHSFIYLFLY